MVQTDRLGLPLLAAGQAQKEVTHNEALGLIDVGIQPVVESADLSTPPGSVTPGQCWVVASSASGAWLGHEGAVAAWTAGGWLFATPQNGWRAWAVDRGNMIRFDGVAWIDEDMRANGYYIAGEQIVGVRQPAIATPSGGTTQDAEARAAIGAMLAALRTHGLIAT
jgi:hypothetical protein